MGMRIAAALAFTVLATAAVIAYASRNSSGTMAAANGPYVAGTVISSAVVNARFSDIEAEITDSLSRSGKGGMTAALRTVDGTVAAPAHSFTSEVGSGLYRIGASDHGFAVAGVKTHEWTATGETVTGTLATTDTVSVSRSGIASAVLGNFFVPSLADGNTAQIVVGKSNAATTAGFLTYTPNATAANSTYCMTVGGQISTLCVDGNAKTIIGSGGTGIGASKVVTVSLTPGAITGPGCNSGAVSGTNVAITNIAFGDTCMMAAPSTLSDGRVWTTCSVSSAGNVTVDICSMINITPPTGTYTIRTFQATN